MTLLQVSAASAGIIQTSDAEHPWNQEWASWSCADASRVQEVSSPAVQGRKAYELTVHDGDNAWGERCELGHGNPGRSGFPLFQNGDERWISFSVYLPDNYPINTPNWNVMFQIHQEGDGGCPPVALLVDVIRVNRQPHRSPPWTLTQTSTGADQGGKRAAASRLN